MKEKIISFLKSPSLALGLFILAMLAVLWAYGARKNPEGPVGNTDSVIARADINTESVSPRSLSTSRTSAVTSKAVTTSSTTTTSTTTTETTTTVAVTTEAVTAAAEPENEPAPEPQPDETTPENNTPSPGQPLSPYLYAGVSPNSAFYQERLAIAGDSIASGYQIYGYIPYGHNIAKESVGLWNLGRNTFNFGYGNMSMVDSVAYMQPKLVMISIGMNDLPMKDPAWFAGLYSDLVDQMIAVDPDVNIVCAGITPVASYVTYSTNENIRNFNAAVENMVAEKNSSQIYYFDAYSVLADSGSLALNSKYSAGDGIHITSASYGDLLTALFNFLDTTPVMENIQNSEGQ
ncbi:MAG TPA: SGNH/GDSL hydrolase family protein [Ruminococcus sp.]|nr:SGNH/GDSL hydrolase family protein [Ruminococcus sp.]